MKIYMAEMSYYWRNVNDCDYEDIEEDVLGVFDSIEKAQHYIDGYGEMLQHVEEKPEEVEKWNRIGIKSLYKMYEGSHKATEDDCISDKCRSLECVSTETISEGYAFFIREFEVQ